MSSDFTESVYGTLPSTLCCSKLGDLCVESGVQTGPFGSQLHQEDYVESGTPIITVEHLGENRINHSNLPLVSDDDRRRLSKYALKTGDIVFSRVGSVDRRALVQQREEGWLFSGRCLRVRPNPEKLDSQWLSYFFALPAFKSYIRGIAVGATMPSLNTKILSDVPIYYPSLSIQRGAATVLSALDDRISLLRETNDTLEAIAQALFKSWFVDFDPVRAKMEGRAPEGMDEATAALFPDGFEESELGLLPKGWQVTNIDAVASKVGMGPFGSNIKVSTFVHEGVPVLNGKNVQHTLLEDTSFSFIGENHAEKLRNSAVCPGDLVITHRGTLGQVSLIPEGSGYSKYMLSQSQFFLRCNLERASPEWMTYFLRSHVGQRRLLANAAQVGVPSIAKPVSYLRSIKLIVPPIGLIDRFTEQAATCHRSIVANRGQIDSLASLRDTLLPRLISGKLRLPEAEALAV